jgi:hypothetical protein
MRYASTSFRGNPYFVTPPKKDNHKTNKYVCLYVCPVDSLIARLSVSLNAEAREQNLEETDDTVQDLGDGMRHCDERPSVCEFERYAVRSR